MSYEEQGRIQEANMRKVKGDHMVKVKINGDYYTKFQENEEKAKELLSSIQEQQVAGNPVKVKYKKKGKFRNFIEITPVEKDNGGFYTDAEHKFKKAWETYEDLEEDIGRELPVDVAIAIYNKAQSPRYYYEKGDNDG